LSDLDGDWRVERLSGLLPPMPGVWKRIRGSRGETRLGPLPGITFQVEQGEGSISLIYRRPFSMIIDKLWNESEGSWVGQATVIGVELGRFRMSRR
jgi:hypothetical protein